VTCGDALRWPADQPKHRFLVAVSSRRFPGPCVLNVCCRREGPRHVGDATRLERSRTAGLLRSRDRAPRARRNCKRHWPLLPLMFARCSGTCAAGRPVASLEMVEQLGSRGLPTTFRCPAVLPIPDGATSHCGARCGPVRARTARRRSRGVPRDPGAARTHASTSGERDREVHYRLPRTGVRFAPFRLSCFVHQIGEPGFQTVVRSLLMGGRKPSRTPPLHAPSVGSIRWLLYFDVPLVGQGLGNHEWPRGRDQDMSCPRPAGWLVAILISWVPASLGADA
jgi:hypothetical protein